MNTVFSVTRSFKSACLALMLGGTPCRAQEIREWRGKDGNSIHAEFVKIEDEVVFLQLEDGATVQAQIDRLCDDDRLYILKKTSVPKDIPVCYGMARTGYLTEVGESPEAWYKDTVTFSIQAPQADGSVKLVKDSRWQYLACELFKGGMKPVNAGYDESLKTEGQFALVTFSVENDSPLPIAVPPPLLIDQRDRKFLPAENYTVAPYVPDGLMKTESDIVQPGFKKRFAAVFEIPLYSEMHALEVFPVKTQPFQVRSFHVAGKKIHIKPKLAGQAGDDAAAAGQKDPSLSAENDFNVFMQCIRLAQGGGRTAGYYYDSSKKRSLAYGVELRATSKKPESLRVKAFFIGQTSIGKDVVVDQQSAAVELGPGRIERVSLQSEEISQDRHYYYGSSSTRTSAKLSGVIIQVWKGDHILKGYSSLSQWKKFETSKSIVEEMGELKRYRD
jgi:hypothetical protein